jgi:hypothetical protein
MNLPRFWCIILAVVSLAGCVRPLAAPSQAAPLQGSLGRHPVDHVVILAIDGLKQDTLVQYLLQAPRLPGGLHDVLGVQTSGNELSFTRTVAVNRAATVFPSYTYPAWTSMFTGVFPGIHGITGNSVFFRDRQVSRYYTEYHLDAVRVQLDKDFFSNDISGDVKSLYQYLADQGGRSVVVHNMVHRGSEARRPDIDTLWNYKHNRSKAVDENSLWDTVHALQELNAGNPSELRLPTVLTVYFSGLDHAEHMSPDEPEKARLAYLAQLDGLVQQFLAGGTISRNHFTAADSTFSQTEPIQWNGLQRQPVFERTLFVLASDHGHTPIHWNDAFGIEDLRSIFQDLSEDSGRPYSLEVPDLIEDTIASQLKALLGFVEPDQIPLDTNVVPTFNGGSLGLHIRPVAGSWDERPDYVYDVKPILTSLLLILHQNHWPPDAILYNTGTRYVVIPYEYTGEAIRLLPPLEVQDSRLNSPDYPMAVKRLAGLAYRTVTDPLSAPDVIILSDRSKYLTFLNKLDWRVIEPRKIDRHRHFHSDHGHLLASDSLVPMLFTLGGYKDGPALGTICEATIVDITPTLLDILGQGRAFEAAWKSYPEHSRGHSLRPLMESILNGEKGDANVCAAGMTTSEEQFLREGK